MVGQITDVTKTKPLFHKKHSVFLRWMSSSKGYHRNSHRIMQKEMGACEVKSMVSCRQEQCVRGSGGDVSII